MRTYNRFFSFFFKDDSGIAYGIYALGLFILFAGLLIAIYSPVFNGLFTGYNNLVTNNLVGEQTTTNMSFARNVLAAMPVFVLIGVALWAWIRSLEKKYTEG